MEMETKTVHLKLGFIGAGAVNFGGAEGPWDHATRIENLAHIEHVIGNIKLCLSVEVVGIADVDLNRANSVLEARRTRTKHSEIWDNTKVFADYKEMLDITKPDCVFIGVPPLFHGQATEGRNMEVECTKRGVHFFVDKPISVQHPDQMRKDGYVDSMDKAEKSGLIISVGYMFRYSRAVSRIKEELVKHFGGAENVRVASVLARYCCAYSNITRKDWWDQRVTAGPIVEQATHFADLARFLGGEVDLKSLHVVGIGPRASNGTFGVMPVDPRTGKPVNDSVPLEHQVPRLTHASWKYTSGAVGMLTHGAMLHGNKYACEIEVWADGFRAVLLDPYYECKLLLRTTATGEDDVEVSFTNDDYYQSELSCFVFAVATNNRDLILSPFYDAMRTYELTWAIKDMFDATQ
jgi:predicted dehydrogenase